MITGQDYAVQLQSSYTLLRSVLDQLDPAEIEHTDLGEGWTPKTLLAHIAFWDDYQTRRMEVARRGETVVAGIYRPAEDNDARLRADRSRPWPEIVAEADAARTRLIDFAAGLDAAALAVDYPEGATRLSLPRLLQHMVRHTEGHAQALYANCAARGRWSQAGLRRYLEAQHDSLIRSVAGLDAAVLAAAPVCETWTARDLLAHVLAWHEYCVRLIEQWPVPAPATVEEWRWREGETEAMVNERLLAARRDLDVFALGNALIACHRRLIECFDAADAATLAGRGRTWGGEDTLERFYYQIYEHVGEHAAQIWAYRAAARQ